MTHAFSTTDRPARRIARTTSAWRRSAQSLGAALLALAGAFGAADRARAEGPVLVELFTSQGCSSCPPADEVLGALAKRDDVVALSFHVDYWDYLGWRDTFADAGHTKRQYGYRDAWGARVVYTPQIVVAGRVGVVGSRAREVVEAVESAVAASEDFAGHIAISRSQGGLMADLIEIPAEAELHVALFSQIETVAIARGENAGREITYTNVVLSYMALGIIARLGASAPLPEPAEGQGVAVWAQMPANGDVMAAAQYRAGDAMAIAGN
ncbi:MAG: DUF1223 domain-containing protein [Pseudomonadota bacterium]